MSESNHCANCGKEETAAVKLLKCSRCKEAKYCSKKCQVSDWNLHKKQCKKSIARQQQTNEKKDYSNSNVLELTRSQLSRLGLHTSMGASGGAVYDEGGNLKALAIDGDAGWSPKTEFAQLTFLPGMLDFHCWCEDNSGVVYDFTPEELSATSTRGTLTIQRKPFNKMLSEQVAQWCRQRYPRDVLQIEAGLCKVSDWETGYCYPRSLTLHLSNPTKFKIVYGSLGFVQSDGRVFWEYG